MNEEEKKLQKHLVDEMMKTYKTNPDVMYYMEALMKYCIEIEQENDRLNNIIEELEKWLKEDKEYAMNNFECGRCFNMFNILDKLKELKEGK